MGSGREGNDGKFMSWFSLHRQTQYDNGAAGGRQQS